MNFINGFAETGNTLLLTLASGTGHIQTAKRMEHDLRKIRPNQNVQTKEVGELLYGKYLSTIGNENFNGLLKNEDINGINRCLKLQHLHDTLLLPYQFLKFIHVLAANDITHVIDTQSIGLKALTNAARVVNFFRQIFTPHIPPVKVSLVMTELPNKDTHNFFPFIKSLSDEDRKIFQLVTTKPLLEAGETDEAFWKKHCDLSHAKGEVVYDALPIRPTFEKLAKESVKTEQLKVRVGTPKEMKQIGECLGEEVQTDESNSSKKAVFPVQMSDKVTYLMLGGQACIEATKEYVKTKIKMAKETASTDRHYLFVFCGKNESDDSLFNQIHSLVEKEKQEPAFPKHMKIVPLSFQTDEEVAPILARSDETITKSGGLTSMELDALARGKIFIHSSYVSDPTASEETLCERGMSCWEAGNARYLKHFHNAKIVTPSTIERAVAR